MGGEGAFGWWFAGGGDGGGGGGRGHDVGDHVVDADGFAGGEGAEGDLDLGHGVGVWVIAGVFAEFLLGRMVSAGQLGESVRRDEG